MRNFGFLIALVSLGLVLSASAGTSKDHKKKLLEKLRAAFNTDGTESFNETEGTVDTVKDLNTPVDTIAEKSETVSGNKTEELSGTDLPSEAKPEDTTNIVSVTTNHYLANLRIVLKRIMEMLGLRNKEKRKEGRNNRMLEMDTSEPNEIEHVPVYREEVRTTVGAVLGESSCIKKVACVAGANLKAIKGKQIIFALLEKFSPKTWQDTVRVAKQAAIQEYECDFKCLEDY